jgi:hypothetical protein
MSEFLKSGNFQGGTSYLNNQNDSTAESQTDVYGLGFRYGGGLNGGDYMRCTDAEALALSLTSVGTLKGGTYRRVKLNGGTFKRGQLVFWDTSSTQPYAAVTNTEPTGVSLIAGVIVNADAGSTAGNWVWIQTEGLATCLFRATITKAGAVGDEIYAAAQGAGADNATVDNLADATTLTSVQLRHKVGIAWEAPANGGLKLVMLDLMTNNRP